MPIRNTTSLLLKSRIAVSIIMAVSFVLGLMLIAQGFIDTRDYQQAVIDAVRDKTGKTVTIKGKVSAALLPTPTLYIAGLELRDAESARPTPALTVAMTRIRVSALSVFSGKPDISGIVMDAPVLELVRGDDHLIHWDWLNTALLKTFSQDAGDAAASLEVVGGKVFYRDNQSERKLSVENINLSATGGHALRVQGGLSIFGHELGLALRTEGNVSAAAAPFVFALSAADGSLMELRGDMDVSGELPQIKATLNLNLSDALIWVRAQAEEKQQLLQQVTGGFRKKPGKVALPLVMTSEWAQRGLEVDMQNVVLQGMSSIGGGSLKLSWDEWKPELASQMHFSIFNYEQWKKLFVTALGTNETDEWNLQQGGGEKDNPLPRDFRVSVNLSAEKFLYGAQSWNNAVLLADLSEGALTANRFSIELPGDAKLTLFGVISQAPTGDMRFEGSMETEGKSIRETLTVFDASAADLPQTGLGTFRARANIFISSEQLRLSEADVRLSDLHLNGGLAAYFDSRPRVEAEVALSGINFDYFRDAWREESRVSGAQDFFLKFNKNINFNWLKRLQTAVDLRIRVDNFTFLERSGSRASFRLYAQPGELGIHDIYFIYPTDILKGTFRLNVTGEQPAIDLMLDANEINTRYFNVSGPADAVRAAATLAPLQAENGSILPAEPEENSLPTPPKPATGLDDIMPKSAREKQAAGQTRWPEELLDMSWMSGFAGNVNLSIARLVHGGIALGNVKLEAVLANEKITLKNFTFSYWNGQCSVLGSIYGGKVPGVSLSAVLRDANLQAILRDVAARDNITGNVSISGALETSGVNFLSWVQQSTGKLVVSGRGVNVNGLNLQGVANAVSISRTAADVFNSVNLALPTGSTQFSVDGSINIKNGVMKTPGIGLRAETVSGNVSGEWKLVPWLLDATTVFQFPSLSSETVPTLTVQLVGSADAPEMRTDTSSLEAFVAKRIISK